MDETKVRAAYAHLQTVTNDLISVQAEFAAAIGAAPPTEPPLEPPIQAPPGVVDVLQLSMAIPAYGMGQGQKKYTGSDGLPTFHGNDAAVIKFITPAQATQLTIDVTHAGGATGASHNRTYVLSRKAGDFNAASGDALWSGEQNAMNQRVTVGRPASGRVDLTPSTAFYINILNTAYGQPGSPDPYNILFVAGNNG